MAAARAHYWQSPNVLLPAAHPVDSSDCNRGLLCPLRTGALDVRVADHRPVPIYSATGVGILFADYLSGMGLRRTDALSAMPVVRGLEATPQRCLAQLFLAFLKWKIVG